MTPDLASGGALSEKSIPLSLWLNRQLQAKRRLARPAFDGQISVVSLRDSMGDAEAESGTGHSTLDRRTSPEPFENARLLRTRYAGAMIGNVDRHHAVV